MSLTNEERNLIVARELARAKEAYDDILYLQKDGRLSAAANRLYYAVFHAVSALLIKDGYQASRHNVLIYCSANITLRQVFFLQTLEHYTTTCKH